MLKIVNDKKLITEEKEELILKEEEKAIKLEDFFNLIVCMTSITRMLAKKELQEKNSETIEQQKQIIISAIGTIAKITGLDEELEKATIKDNELKEELNPVERYEFDVIPQLRFLEVQQNLNTIVDGYTEIGDNISYEKTCEIATDLTRIENALDNIATVIGNELKTNLIYKE